MQTNLVYKTRLFGLGSRKALDIEFKTSDLELEISLSFALALLFCLINRFVLFTTF